MYAKKEMSQAERNRRRLNSVAQKRRNEKKGFELVDNRAEVIAQRKHKMMAGNVQHSSINTLFISPGASHQVVQRLKGAKGTAQENQKAPYTLNPEFITKHVANNLAEAISVTEDRIKTGSPPGIVAGIAPNNLAKESEWRAAIDSCDDIVPPEDEWEGGYGDDTQWAERIASVSVNGWEAIGTKGNVTAKVATNKKSLGGQWTVSGCQFDTNQDYVNASGKAGVDISHLAS
ncbi:hypothetical protein EGM70_12990 [Enterobacteriaceae bacterium 89]|nr:hypothetical protein [Enterobacteriaceae bacterium 89]